MASKFSHLPDISTTQPDRLIKYRVSDDRFSAEVLLPGLSYTDFDQKIGGKVHLGSLAKICECVRSVCFNKGFAYFPERHRKTRLVVFLVSQVFCFTREAHWVRGGSHFGLNKPQKFLMYLSQAGTTSYTTHMDWFDSDNKKIGYFLTKHVSADVRTRRPVAHPEYFYKNIEPHLLSISSQSIERADAPEIHRQAFCLKVRVLYSDCDAYKHVNQSTYLKWCSDAASEAANAGHLSLFKTHIELYQLNRIEMHHPGEAYVGDELSVHVWQVEGYLVFAIQKAGNLIFHMNMTFHDSQHDETSTKLAAKI